MASAAVVLIVALCLTETGVSTAYAVGQTLEAIKAIRTVHMRGEFVKQGTFECWMRFAGDPDRPTHVWLGRPGRPNCKICSPEGVFGLNLRTQRVHFAQRDERDKTWFPPFGTFFRQTLEEAQRNAWITVTLPADVNTPHGLIVVDVRSPKRDQQFLVDPGTKLPVSMTTLRDDDPAELMRKTLWVKRFEWIRYNEEPPAGLFEMPKDAVVVDQEVDTLVDPDSGLIVHGLTKEQACIAIVEQTAKATVDLDRATLTRLGLTFRIFPDMIWDQITTMKDSGQWVEGFSITGQPYQEGG
ncbi:MAG: hypothetical protein KBE04_15595, partial [Phycisphaerae bacterium]|nr:hypothetical protein [Phycisphaerae bacterium]